MLNVKVFNQEGAEVKDLELNEAVFGIEPHKQAMFDMVLLQRASLRQGTHKVKNRTEVAGGGRKPWRQLYLPATSIPRTGEATSMRTMPCCVLGTGSLMMLQCSPLRARVSEERSWKLWLCKPAG